MSRYMGYGYEKLKIFHKSGSRNKAGWMIFHLEFVNVLVDWDGILESWMKPKWMRRSKVGDENRKKVPEDVEGTSSYVRHTDGSKSFRAHT
uniref:GRAS protein n=1 Tax=Tanacetum cinerariifolium TaxID=118510 RepID=A0A699HQH5_TANCI|nr:GRAS protein [Tanacetum cinerariifolium]